MAEGFYIPQLDVEEFSEYLLDRGFDATVTRAFEENRISGAVFVKLTDDDLKELVPLIDWSTSVNCFIAQDRYEFGSLVLQWPMLLMYEILNNNTSPCSYM